MKTKFFLALLPLLFATLYSCRNISDNQLAEDTVLSKSIELDSIGTSLVESGTIMGLSIAIAREGEIIYSNGFGYIDSLKTKPVETHHFFQIASISKLVGATMTAKLVEEGKLSWEAALDELLPEFPVKEQSENINLRQLLDHTSGMRDYANTVDSIYLSTGIDPTLDDIYDYFQKNALDFEPGSHFNYSNSGYYLMYLIIERATGSTYSEELDRVINVPSGLNIKHTQQRINDPLLTTMFNLEDSIFVHRPHWPWIIGDGGLTATAEDLALFGHHWGSGTFVSEESFKYLCTPTVLSDGVITGYGAGVRTGNFEGEPVLGHTGGESTSWSTLQYYPEIDTSIVVFVNTDNTPNDALAIIGPVALKILGKEEPVLKDLQLQLDDAEAFLGDYKGVSNRYYGDDTYSIVKYEGESNLFRKRKDSESKGQRLYYLGDDTFGYDSYPMDRVVFQRNEQGEVIVFNNYWNGLRKGGLYRKQH